MESIAVSAFIVFMRVTGFLLVLPGFSTSQVPAMVRLFVAFGVTILVLSLNGIPEVTLPQSAFTLFRVMFVEFAVGVAFGFPVRLLFLLVQSLGEIITNLIGLNPLPGAAIAGEQPTTTISSLLHITSIVLLFSTGVHFQLIIGISQSYALIPVQHGFGLSGYLEMLVEELAFISLVIMRLCAPFIVYAFIVNFTSGIINKLTPQVPVYFVSAPFLIAGGLGCIYVLGDDIAAAILIEARRLSSFAY